MNLTYTEYDDLPGIRSTQLKLAATSLLHFHAHVPKESSALDAGSALHCAVFEPHDLFDRFTVYTKRRQGAEWEAFKADAHDEDKRVLYPAEWDKACAMRAAVLAHPVASRLVSEPGICEESLQWTDAKTGLICKARLDKRCYSRPLVWDLKSARRIDDHGFSRAIFDYGYHISAAHYLAGADAVYGCEHEWKWVAVESGPPFDVRVAPIHEDALWFGREERTRLLRLIAEATERDEWPGQFPDEAEADLPAWAYPSEAEVEDRITITRE